jgi:hypothetical protein
VRADRPAAPAGRVHQLASPRGGSAVSSIETRDEALRVQAIEQLKKRADFLDHLAAYVLVNGLLVVIWFVTGRPFFWPVFPLFAWGIGLFFHGVETYRRPFSEDRIRREMRRLGSGHHLDDAGTP